MTDFHNVSSDETKIDSQTQEALSELRSLLLGVEQSELEKLHERLKNPNLSADELSQMLPEAIVRLTDKHQGLTEALVPNVEEAIAASVQKDPDILAEAIYPIVGPAARKAIATAMEGSIQTLNQAVDQSLSPQSLKWRLEALQTGKSFAEIVLLHNLVYRVEQIFVIHRKTGLLLQHVVADGVDTQDADLISAMLTAIESFVQDSFKVQPGDVLEMVQLGELTIWIEQGPQAILAGVIRGNAPRELKLVFQDALEKFHLNYSNNLKSFNGDNAFFTSSQTIFENCLKTGYKPKKNQISPTLWVVLGSVLIALGSWGFSLFIEAQKWSAYLEKLQSEPGIVITASKKVHRKYFIAGLRDPLAADPNQIMAEKKINPQTVISQWKPFLSLENELVLVRAKKLLRPPKTVSLSLDENGILYARGSAPRRWLLQTRRLATTIPGINKFKEELSDINLQKLNAAKQRIEKQLLRFERGNQKLLPGQERKIKTLASDMQNLREAAQALGKKVRIRIIGHTDKEGTENTNIRLSKVRANAVRSTLSSKGIQPNLLAAVGVGNKKPLRQESSEKDKAYNRSVSFRVILTDGSN